MKPETLVAIQKLGESAKRLNEVSDTLNVYFNQINQALATLNIGLIFDFPMANSGTTLSYAKFDNKWELLISNQLGKWPVVSAPRHLRVATVNFLPLFLEGYERFVTAQVKEVEYAAQLAESFVKGIKE